MVHALFRALLRLYPRAFRHRFGDAMEEAFVDRVEEARERAGLSSAWMIGRTLADLALSALGERIRPTYHDTPNGSDGPEGTLLMDHLVQDLRFAVRSLRRRPGFTLAALFTLALGIGANTAVFTVVNGVLLRPLDYAEPEQLHMLWTYDTEGEPDGRGWMSLPDIDDLRELDAIRALEGWQSTTVTLTDGDMPERVSGARVTGGMLELFGVAPLAGRDLRHEENSPDAPRVVVLSHDFWRQHLDGRPDVVGSTLELSEITYEVVGIAPEGFDFPEGSQLWVPYRHSLEGCGRGCSVYQTVARLGDGVTPEGAAQPLSALATALADEYPETNTEKSFRVEPLLSYQVGDVRAGLWVLLGAVGLVLLIVCANVANLLLVRASTRKGEVSVRAALGASRGRLVGQILTESVVLAGCGAALGVALSVVLLEGFRAIAPVSVPRIDEVGLDATVLLFAAGLTLAVSILFGLSPALHLARSSSAGELTGGARSGGGRREGRARSVLIAAEIGLSLALLFGAGLLMRSLGELYQVDLGFHERDVVRFSLSLPGARYDTLPEIASFYRELEERIASFPGVESVGSVQGAPLAGGNIAGGVDIEGRPEPEPGDWTYASVRAMTPGYFETLGLTLLRGRGIERTDDGDAEPVAVVNEAFVAENFPEGDPIGERVYIGSSFGYGSPTWTIVGVVRDVRRTLTGQPTPELYVPHSKFGPGSLTVHVRGAPGVESLMPTIREEIRAMDPNLVATNVETIGQAIRDDAATARFYLLLVGIFAGLAVVLASVGLYGVIAYVVSRRTREIGIRIALGARAEEIRRMVVRQGAVQTLWGVGLGIAVSLIASRWLESLLFNVRPADPLVLAAVSVLIVGVSMAAIVLPARRATRVDPTRALRAE